jgi:hypothetical protein
MDETGVLTPEEFWARLDETARVVRDGLPFTPVFGVNEWTSGVSIGEWSLGEGTHSLQHGDPAGTGPSVLVQTGPEDPRVSVILLRVAATGGFEDEDELRSGFRAYDTPPDDIVEIDVGGTPVLFEAWSDGDTAWAAGRFGMHNIAIESHHVPLESISLHRVLDIEPYIAGHRSLIREARGED